MFAYQQKQFVNRLLEFDDRVC